MPGSLVATSLYDGYVGPVSAIVNIHLDKMIHVYKGCYKNINAV